MRSELERECEKSPKVTGDFRYGEAKPPTDPDWHPAHNWKVTLRHEGRRLTVDFYAGDLVPNPSVADVLSSVMLDTRAGEQSFEEFCAGYGYPTDSRRTYAMWLQCQSLGRKVRRFLGESWDRFDRCEH